MNKRRAGKPRRAKPLSLYPLTVEEALKAALATPPPKTTRFLRESAARPKRHK